MQSMCSGWPPLLLAQGTARPMAAYPERATHQVQDYVSPAPALRLHMLLRDPGRGRAAAQGWFFHGLGPENKLLNV
jgi:hypothetical protein